MRVELITPIAAVVVASVVAVVSFFQWRTNREKLRLDLYNRRFDIYARTLDFYQIIYRYDGSEVHLDTQKRFIAASRESRFIFPKSSGVFEYITEFQNHAIRLIEFEHKRAILRGFSKEQSKLLAENLEDMKWLDGCMATMEGKMEKCLQFD